MVNNRKRVLITGALGQDGKILSKILYKKKYFVTGWIKKKKYTGKIKGVKYLHVSLKNKREIYKNLILTKPSTVVHFASENPSYVDKKLKRKIFARKNFIYTKNLIDTLINYNKEINFIFSNSSQIFSKYSKKKRVNERNTYLASNEYTKFRIKTIEYLKKFKNNKKFKYTNLILFNHDSKYRNKKFLIPRLIFAIKNNNNEFINKIYKENIIGDFSHAKDICEAIYILIKKNIFIDNLLLSSSKKTKINSIIRYILKKYPNSIKLFAKPIKNNSYIIGNNSLAKRILGWKLKKNVFEAVDEIFKV